MLDNLILQIASDLSSFCHLGNFLGAIPAGRKKRKLLIAGAWSRFTWVYHDHCDLSGKNVIFVIKKRKNVSVEGVFDVK